VYISIHTPVAYMREEIPELKPIQHCETSQFSAPLQRKINYLTENKRIFLRASLLLGSDLSDVTLPFTYECNPAKSLINR
jgi:hypothetical protein